MNAKGVNIYCVAENHLISVMKKICRAQPSVGQHRQRSRTILTLANSTKILRVSLTYIIQTKGRRTSN